MTAPYFEADGIVLHLGDCLNVLRTLPDQSVDAICTDPPAGIAFMGRDWDRDKGGRDRWIAWLADVMGEAHRVLKPGGHALVWALPRTSHWTAMALEDAGFEIRDCIVHLFGSGFPKSLDVSKAIDKAAGATREVVGRYVPPNGKSWNLKADEAVPGYSGGLGLRSESLNVTAPATEEAQRWEGWGTALKPSQEHWWLVRKPLAGTVAHSVVTYGTGALNVDACRVPGEKVRTFQGRNALGVMNDDGWQHKPGVFESHDAGRWPTNLLFTHSASCVEDGPCAGDCPSAELDRQTAGTRASKPSKTGSAGADRDGVYGGGKGLPRAYTPVSRADDGGASRFYPVFRYEPKASASERPHLPDGTTHNTVKPLALMRWLVRLVCPPGGTVLDPFAGSGTTGEACLIEGFNTVLIELKQPYAELIKARLSKPLQPALDFGEAV